MRRLFLLLLFLAGLCLLNACGGGGNSSNSGNAQPTVMIVPSTKAVSVGGSVKLTWSSTKVTSCTASSSPSQSDWSGSEPTSGSKSVTPAAEGTVSYTLACSGTSGSASLSVMITVNPPALTITTTALPNGVVGSPYGSLHIIYRNFQYYIGHYFQLTASGGTGGYGWVWAAAPGSSLPPGLACCLYSFVHRPPAVFVVGAIHGVPSTTGTYHVIVTVSDGESPPAQASVPFDIVVSLPPPPVIKTKPAPSAGAVGLPYSSAFTATGGLLPLGPWSETGTLPDGLKFGIDGVLSGTPTTVGTSHIVVTVQDAAGQKSAPQAFDIAVYPHGFKATDSMGTPRQYHTATLLPSDGTVLVIGGLYDTSTGSLASAELYDPVAKTFSATTGAMTSARELHTTTLLNDGTVLVAGGYDPNVSETFTTADLYDPTSKTFTAITGTMTSARSSHTATLLNDSTVLITGGFDFSTRQPIATAELYDPATKTFTATTGNLASARYSHTATLLSDGTVLLTGGFDANNQAIGTAELYDPASKTFAPTVGNLTTARSLHTATLLNDSTVLLTGGYGGSGSSLAAAELYDPGSKTFTATTGNMTTARYLHTATLLNDSTVLLSGGADDGGNRLAAAELFDPPAKAFTVTGSLTTARISHTATLLSDGTVLVTGGTDATGAVLATAEVFQ